MEELLIEHGIKIGAGLLALVSTVYYLKGAFEGLKNSINDSIHEIRNQLTEVRGDMKEQVTKLDDRLRELEKQTTEVRINQINQSELIKTVLIKEVKHS